MTILCRHFLDQDIVPLDQVYTLLFFYVKATNLLKIKVNNCHNFLEIVAFTKILKIDYVQDIIKTFNKSLE